MGEARGDAMSELLGSNDVTVGGAGDRRIGWRAPVVGVVLDWVVPRQGVLAFGRTRTSAGTVVDVSLTGAAVLGPAELPFAIGDTAIVRYEGADSSVIVRRRVPTDDPATHLFGVELMVVHPALMRLIDARIVEARKRMTAAPEPASAPALLLEF